jgi:hypothetical protein
VLIGLPTLNRLTGSGRPTKLINELFSLFFVGHPTGFLDAGILDRTFSLFFLLIVKIISPRRFTPSFAAHYRHQKRVGGSGNEIIAAPINCALQPAL